MRYYKLTDAEGNLTAIGTGVGGVEITAAEYAALAEEIRQKAALVSALAAGSVTAEDIREDWRDEIVRRAAALSERAESYTKETLEEMTNSELEQILYSLGVSASMTKANMVTLILALQGGGEGELV